METYNIGDYVLGKNRKIYRIVNIQSDTYDIKEVNPGVGEEPEFLMAIPDLKTLGKVVPENKAQKIVNVLFKWKLT